VTRILLLFSLVAAPAFAEVAADPEAKMRAELAEVCAKVLCREVAPIRLALPDGEKFEMTPALSTPIVAGDWITVYPNETVNVEARLAEGRLVELVAVREVRDPARTLAFDLKQDPKLGDGTHMMLQVKSPFPGVLKYRLGMMLPSGDEIRKTSSCPLRSGIPVFEHWPHPIFQLVAADFRAVDPESEAARTCE
jgi:hypothetical protein